MNTVMNLLVPYKDGNFLVILATDFFAGRTLPQGAVYFVGWCIIIPTARNNSFSTYRKKIKP
jgi:hypothetical protein